MVQHMIANNNLILIKNEDKTENIETWTYKDGYSFITFCGEKTYKDNYLNVQFYKDLQLIDIENVIMEC